MTEGDRLINEKEFRHMLGGVCRTTFWKMEQADGFPRRISLPCAERRKVWLWSEAVSYIRKLASN